MITFISDIIAQAGYFGIAILMFVETLFPPIPSELIMPFAGYTASMGKLSLVGVLIAGFAGSLAGTLLLYGASLLIDNTKIEDWLERHGSKIGLRMEKYLTSREWFERNNKAAIFFGRLIPGVRSIISIPAGMGRMHPVKFIFYSGLGTALWTSTLTIAGFLLGSQYEKVAGFSKTYGLIAFTLLLILLIWQFKFKRK